jgi:transcriptional regulator with XRE-family HTH domain
VPQRRRPHPTITPRIINAPQAPPITRLPIWAPWGSSRRRTPPCHWSRPELRRRPIGPCHEPIIYDGFTRTRNGVCSHPVEDPDKVIERVGRRIAELREDAGLTQADVAKRLDTALTNLQRMEHGLQNLTIRTMVKLAGPLAFRRRPSSRCRSASCDLRGGGPLVGRRRTETTSSRRPRRGELAALPTGRRQSSSIARGPHGSA